MGSEATYGIADRVGYLTDVPNEAGADPRVAEATVYAARLPDGPVVALHDSAALIWAATASGGTAHQIVTATARAAQVPSEAIEHDVVDFIEDLVDRGLVVRSEAEHSADVGTGS